MAVDIPEGFGQVSVEITSSLGTGPFYNTFGVALPDGIALLDVVNFAFQTWVDAWGSLTFDDYTFNRAILTVPAPGGGLGSVVSDLPSEQGSPSGSPEVVATAVVISKLSGLVGRHGRGRFFMPGLLGTTDVLADGSLLSASVTTYTETATAWLEEMEAGDPDWDLGLNPQILHSSGTLPPTAISGLRCSPTVGWLRKRLR